MNAQLSWALKKCHLLLDYWQQDIPDAVLSFTDKGHQNSHRWSQLGPAPSSELPDQILLLSDVSSS
jgi:hypothetical protein